MNYFFVRFLQMFVLFLGILPATYAQNELLDMGDSLFSNQKYTEAFELYDSVFVQGQASPSMLMKMAFIKEGLGDYANALYYLNLYYDRSSDKAAAEKMRELAEENSLRGYEYSDFKFVSAFIRQYKIYIVGGLILFSIFLLFYGMRKFKRKEKPMVSLGLQVVTIALIVVLSNELFLKQKAIITTDYAFLMEGPSAGSEPINVVTKGNKVILVSSDEVWSAINWSGKTVFVRTKNLKFL
mgnify:CR=1 FL=1